MARFFEHQIALFALVHYYKRKACNDLLVNGQREDRHNGMGRQARPTECAAVALCQYMGVVTSTAACQ